MVLILVAVAGAVTFACSVCAAPPVPQVEAPVAFALFGISPSRSTCHSFHTSQALLMNQISYLA